MVSVNENIPLVNCGYATSSMIEAIERLIRDQRRAMSDLLRREARRAGERGDRRKQTECGLAALELDLMDVDGGL
jgi:aerobic-type carbon monoxide dehydrogenase small subunit (CoxS/CutS family)